MANSSKNKHPPLEVWQLFESLALDLWKRGWKRYSCRGILQRIRWYYHVDRGDREFKCNNNWSPGMARTFLRLHPECGGFFETRIR